jgi:GntR family transcriptional regulator
MQPLKLSKLPLSFQAQQYLLDLIEEGTYQPGDQLPSEADLASQLGIARGTLREALLNLEQESVVIRKHGVGTFVAPGYGRRLDSGLERLESVLELAARRGKQVEFDSLQVQDEPADPDVSAKLQIDCGTQLTSVRRVIVADGVPVAYMQDLVLPAVLSPADVDGTFNGSVLDLLRRKQEQLVVQATADIVACNADTSLAKKLGIESAKAVLLIEETLFDKEDTAVGFSRNYFIPDFFRFHVLRR